MFDLFGALGKGNLGEDIQRAVNEFVEMSKKLDTLVEVDRAILDELRNIHDPAVCKVPHFHEPSTTG